MKSLLLLAICCLSLPAQTLTFSIHTIPARRLTPRFRPPINSLRHRKEAPRAFSLK